MQPERKKRRVKTAIVGYYRVLYAKGKFFEFLNEKYPAQFKNFINLIVYHDEDYRSAIEEATEKEWAVISREETQWSGERLMKLINTGK